MAEEPREVSQPGRTAEVSATTPASPSPTTAEITTRLEETRADMGETIRAAQERLRPSRPMTHANEPVKEPTAGPGKSLTQRATGRMSRSGAASALGLRRILQHVKRHPVPIAFIGILSAAMLLRAGRQARYQANAEGPNRTARHALRTQRSRTRTARGRNFLAAAGVGAACWGIWKARAATHRVSGSGHA